MRFLIPLIVAALDQWIKYEVRNLPYGQVFFRVPGLLELVPSFNTGAAFSVFSGHAVLLAAASIVLMAVAVIYMIRTPDLTRPASAAGLFLIGGGMGNLIDRILFGGVTDYIRITCFNFPVFNLADVTITCSVVVLIVLLMMNQLVENSGDNYE